MAEPSRQFRQQFAALQPEPGAIKRDRRLDDPRTTHYDVELISKAGDVMVSAMTLPGALVLVIGYLGMDPLMAKSLHAIPVQIVLGGVVITMVVGYFVMRSIAQEAV